MKNGFCNVESTDELSEPDQEASGFSYVKHFSLDAKWFKVPNVRIKSILGASVRDDKKFIKNDVLSEYQLAMKYLIDHKKFVLDS